MNKVQVCLVSEQTIPNILSIYDFKPDEILFLSTKVMKEKGKVAHIINALKEIGLDYKNKYTELVVVENSLLDCKKKFDEWIAGKENSEFLINLTCGTKIMSIAAYDYFKDYGSKMGYIPINSNVFIFIFPKNINNVEKKINLKLKVNAYLKAYGLKIFNQDKLIINNQEAENRRELTKYIVENYEKVKPLLQRFSEKLRKHRGDKKGFLWSTSYSPESTEEKELFDKIGFIKEGNEYKKQLSQSEIICLTGGWLEEFCYNELLQFKGNGIDDILISVGVKDQKDNQNEFDVMFTKDNTLYTIECKSLEQANDPKTDALYKIAALQKEFGLKVHSFFVSTSPNILKDGELKPSIKARAEQLNTTVIKPDNVIKFASIISDELKLNQ